MNSWTWPEAETTLCIFRRLYNRKDRKSFCRICTRRAILIGLNCRHFCILYPVLFINQCVCIAVCLFFYLIKHSTGFDTYASETQLNLCAAVISKPLCKTSCFFTFNENTCYMLSGSHRLFFNLQSQFPCLFMSSSADGFTTKAWFGLNADQCHLGSGDGVSWTMIK